MKRKSIYNIAAITALLTGAVACKKESKNIFNMFTDVTVTYHNKHPFAVVDYKDVNDGDSVYLDYTVTSAKQDMYMICVLKVGSTTPFLKIPINDPAQRRSYSGIVRLAANENVGETSYRVWALDEDGVYMGDGYKKVTINVLPNFTNTPNRNVFLPDSVGKTMANYYSIAKGRAYTYAEAQANAADIDFGVYRKYNPASSTPYTYFIYSLSADPLPFTTYDISTWTKRATLFSAPVTGHATTFNTTLTTGTKIMTEARKRTINLRSVTTALLAGSAVYFLTPEGKYGAILFNSITTDQQGNPFLNINTKIQH